MTPAMPNPLPAAVASRDDSSNAAPGSAPKTLRVDLDRVDRLVNMVSEIVITQAAMAQTLAERDDDGLKIGHATDAMTRHIRELQESVMAIRAQPVKGVFSRMARLVRDLAQQLGKEVQTEISGAHTEIDSTVINELAEPLIHIVRNAMDHGIEPPDGRAAAVIDDADRHPLAPLMITDAEFDITYVNPALQETLAQSREFWRTRAPGVDFDHLVGINFDAFHKNTSKQRSMMKAMRGEHRTPITFDPRTFNLRMAPIEDAHGDRIGYAVLWEERTEALKNERQVAEVIEAVAEGDFSRRVSVDSDDKFINDINSGLNGFCEIVEGFMADLERTLSAMAEGDLTKRIDTEYAWRLGEVSRAVNDSTASLGRLVFDITSTVHAITTSTGEIAEGAGQLSTRTEDQASSLEQTAATMEQMAATVKSNAEKANAMSSDTAGRAERGQDVVQETAAAMNRIKESAAKISDIISVIDGIAFQTNLLALNAAVEAARAGDAGKGFAVVASEVRTLAQRSSQAAKDITALIGDSTAHVTEGVRLTETAGDALREIVEGIVTVAKTIDGITAASREQSTGVNEISQTVSHLDSMTQQNAGLADQSAATARTLAGQARNLSDIVRVFRIESGNAAAPGPETAAKLGGDAPAVAKLAASSRPGIAARAEAASPPLRQTAGSDWSEF